MTTETTPTPEPRTKIIRHAYPSGSNAVYGLGLIGAAVYFIQQAPTLWLGVLGFLKAIVWPAFVVYRLMDFLKM